MKSHHYMDSLDEDNGWTTEYSWDNQPVDYDHRATKWDSSTGEITIDYPARRSSYKETQKNYNRIRRSALDKMNSEERKNHPVYSGVLNYFPDAIAYIAKVSKAGNDKHNPGMPLHWSRDKSTDHLDCIARHLIDAGKLDSDGMRHSGMLAWRALANLQIEIENDNK